MYKVCCVVAGVVLLLPLWLLAQSGTDSAAGKLAAMQDKFRPLLIFYPPEITGRKSAIRIQRTLLSGHGADLEDRDVSLIFIPLNPYGSTSPDSMADLRKQFQIDSRRFAVVLLGKDGNEKFRSHEPVTIEKLDALIDAMPMRQQEVRDGHHAK